MDRNKEYVVLVSESGEEIGTEEKIVAHEKGLLHKAFSIFIFNALGEMLLQKRASTKYHFGGLWSNSCCSHQRLNELDEDAAHRRLNEELGFDTDLKQVFNFTYKAKDPVSGLIEHEHDVVFVGLYNGKITPNPEEVEEIKWVSLSQLFPWMEMQPDSFTFWFKTALLELKERGLLSIDAIEAQFDSEFD